MLLDAVYSPRGSLQGLFLSQGPPCKKGAASNGITSILELSGTNRSFLIRQPCFAFLVTSGMPNGSAARASQIVLLAPWLSEDG